MKLKLSRGKNLFLVGDLKITIISGRVEIFGWKLNNGTIEINKLVSAPLIALDDVELEINFGEEGYVAETPFRLIPESWEEASKKILEKEKAIVLVVANVDSGKSGFICYVANKALEKNKKVVIVNTDTGQSEMNPPTTLGYAVVEKPLIHLSQLKYKKAFFIGSTSPAGLFDRSMVGLIRLIEEAKKEDPDLILINTTGWVHNPGGRELKELKVLAVRSNFVVLIEKEKDELHYLRQLLERMKIEYEVLASAPRMRVRSREERRQLRQVYYAREFEGAKDITILMDDVAFMYSFFGSGADLEAEEMLKVVSILGFKPEHIEKTYDYIIISTQKQISQEQIDMLTKELGKQIKIIDPSSLEGLIVGLLDDEGFLEALGMIKRFDPETKVLTIYTRADPNKIKIIALGRIKLNENLEEIEWIEPWSI